MIPRALAGRDRGQILPLFALIIVVLFAFAALAIDVSSVYAARRAYRAVADAAALAGAQDLQAPGGRSVTDGSYVTARLRAVDVVRTRLGGTASCTTSGAVRSCTLTIGGASVYQVKVVSPVQPGGCEACDETRSVQVGVTRVAYPLTFARILGFASFRVGVTSVGGLGYARKYTLVTLRPSQTGQESEHRDISIGGGTDVVVVNGDVATNGNMYIDNNSSMALTDGYEVDFYRRNRDENWAQPPASHRIPTTVKDPGYWLDAYRNQRPVSGNLVNPAPLSATECADVVRSLPTTYTDVFKIAAADTTCYRPGLYTSAAYGSNGLTIPNNKWAILMPGMYFFDVPLVVQGGLIGGFEPDRPGVTLVFREAATQFKLRTNGAPALAVLLNAGDRDLSLETSDGSEAAPAIGFDGTTRIQTNPESTREEDRRPLTVVVEPDLDEPCIPLPETEPIWKLSKVCLDTEGDNAALDLAGGSALYLGGVQYAPEDNVTVHASSADGYVGQIWAWTLTYGGGARIVQEGGETVGPGLLRLDEACTTPDTVCKP